MAKTPKRTKVTDSGEQIAKLKAQLKELGIGNTHLLDSNQKLEQSVHELESILVKVRARRDHAQGETSALKEIVVDLQGSNQSLTSCNASLEADNATLKERNSELEVSAAAAEAAKKEAVIQEARIETAERFFQMLARAK